ncbi:MAG TPA: glycosyltransferase family 2 protein [Rhodanobacteraceae bacterium]|jgi:glycosyltransferase involved in cell wall biosynthesis|nr:glycosyltransferase family 2 protein [Rhodanobacteraceae bacterium]
MGAVMYSVVIPVYRNQESLPDLIDALKGIDAALDGNVEAVFVVDGSPDQSFPTLRQLLPHASFASQLVLLSRNFGSFAAIRCGLQAARGDYFAVLAADLQEPPELMVEFFHRLARDEADVMIGTRDSRDDPALTRFLSKTFWALYRRLINPEIPRGGVDVFACNREFRNQLLQLDEGHSSLIGLLFWLGFRRGSVSYKRRARKHGASAWTFRRKLTYMLDSIFAFSDLPVRLLLFVGVVGMSVSALFGATVLVLRLFGQFDVPGYAATITAILFFGGLNALGLGVIGAYVWRAYANTQRRPLAVVMRSESFPAGGGRA